jgi:very-short-patch-repair endonuclease
MEGGAHSLPSNIERDIEKGNAAVMDGWRVLRFTPQMVKSGAAVRLLEKLLV